MLVSVGGPKSRVGRDAINIVSSLEYALAEVRDWPPEVEADEIGDYETEEERQEAYDEVWEENFDEAISEAKLWLGLAHKSLGALAVEAARHLDPSFRDHLGRINTPKLPWHMRHPRRALRRRAQHRRAMAELQARREGSGRRRWKGDGK